MINIFRRSLGKSFLVITGFLLFVLTVLFIERQRHGGMLWRDVQIALMNHAFLLTALRWLLIILSIITWPGIIRWYAKKQHWENEKIQFWLGQRFRVAGWLIIFELLVCENILLSLIKLL